MAGGLYTQERDPIYASQVVDLPGPGPHGPLRLFLRVPHLRILVSQNPAP
jgi:hypothetical protein